MAAKKEADAVRVIKEACMADARRIAGEKGDAEEDLAQAKPFLEEAERAVESIKVTPGEQNRYRVSHVFTALQLKTRRNEEHLIYSCYPPDISPVSHGVFFCFLKAE